MEIKTQPFNKVHMPTIERHIKNLKEASAYLMGIAADAAIEGHGNGWAEIGMEGSQVITRGRAYLEKLKNVNTVSENTGDGFKITIKNVGCH